MPRIDPEKTLFAIAVLKHGGDIVTAYKEVCSQRVNPPDPHSKNYQKQMANGAKMFFNSDEVKAEIERLRGNRPDPSKQMMEAAPP